MSGRLLPSMQCTLLSSMLPSTPVPGSCFSLCSPPYYSKAGYVKLTCGLRAITIPEQRAKTHEFRYLGMEYWKLHDVAELLPLLIQISLLLFAISLVLYRVDLFHISKPSFRITTGIIGISVMYYVITTTISVLITSSPLI